MLYCNLNSNGTTIGILKKNFNFCLHSASLDEFAKIHQCKSGYISYSSLATWQCWTLIGRWEIEELSLATNTDIFVILRFYVMKVLSFKYCKYWIFKTFFWHSSSDVLTDNAIYYSVRQSSSNTWRMVCRMSLQEI